MKGIFLKMGLIFLIIIYPSSICFADEFIKGHYCYTYGDNESLKEARETTRMLAIRNAIESYRVFITSASRVANFQLTNDLIQIISSGYLKDIRTIEHKEEGRTICESIQASVSPQAIENIVRNEVRKRTRDIEEAGVDSNEYLKIISVRLSQEKTGNRYVYALIKALQYTQYANIFITFFDLEGNPIGGKRKEIRGLFSGEFRDEFICGIDDPRVKSYKVWLQKNK